MPAPSRHTPKTPLAECLCTEPLQMLVRIARQSRLGDPDGCAAILTLLATGRLVRGHLQRVLHHLGLTEVKLSTLVTLYALDPDPATPAGLADQTQVSRATMTETIESLRLQGWLVRERALDDRRTQNIRLTDEGRAFVEGAVRPFLTAVGRCAAVLTRAEQRLLTEGCSHLCTHLQAS